MKNIIIDGVEYNLTQVKKEYEILSFKTPSNNSLMVGKTVQGWYTGVLEVGNNDFRDEQWLLKHKYLIESVKRLSDGQIFKIGDKVNWVTDFIIKGFSLNGNHCYADIININSLSLTKPQLFTTFDGVDIYEGDEVTWLFSDNSSIAGTRKAEAEMYRNLKYFSTKEAAQKYIDSKRVLFCTEDGVDVFEGDIVYSVNITHYNINKNISGCTNFGNNPVFSTEEAAREFILWNKPSLSLKQIEDTVNLHWQDLEKLKEVIK